MLQNITLSAEKKLIEEARRRAEQSNTTLNAEFRRWLEQYANASRTGEEYMQLMKKLDYVRSGGTYTRDQLNER